MKKYKDISEIEEGWGDFKDAVSGGQTQADWVDPNGKLYKVKDTHMEFVARHPKLFKTEIGTLKRIFDKHSEVFPKQENKARIEILTKIVKRGWIRTRYRPREGAWTLETYKWGTREIKAARKWAKVKSGGNTQFRINFVSTSKQKLIGHSFSIDLIKSKGNDVFEAWMKEIMEITENVNLQESSLSRIWKHAQLHQTGTITAFRYARDCGEGTVYTKGENKARNKKLESKLLSKGYGITKIQGIYIENYKSNNEIEVKEESFFVVDLKDNKKLLLDLKKLGREFDQDSICFGLHGGKRYTVFGTNDCPNAYPGKGKNIKLGDAIFGNSGKFISRVNGRPFIFNGSVKTKLPEMITYESLSIQSKEVVDKISNTTWESFYVSNKDILENEK
jgi:hypothetical protein